MAHGKSANFVFEQCCFAWNGRIGTAETYAIEPQLEDADDFKKV